MISLSKLTGKLSRQPKRNAIGPIGLDLAQEKLHMLQLEKSGDALVLRAGVSVPYPVSRDELLASPKSFAALIKRLCKENPFQGRKVVTCLPAGQGQIMNLTYQANTSQHLDEIIVQQVVQRLGGRGEDLVIDYLPIRDSGAGGTESTALVAVAPREEVISYLDLFKGAGLEVATLDIGPAALRRLVGFLDRSQSYPTVLLVNFGREKSYLTVITGTRLIMDRELNFGERTLAKQLSKTLNMDENEALKMLCRYGLAQDGQQGNAGDADGSDPEIVKSIAEILKPKFLELTEEIHKALIYTASETRGKSIERVELLGSVADYPGAAAFLSAMFSIPVHVLNPLDLFDQTPESFGQQGGDSPVRIALATGLALRGFSIHE